MISSVSIKRKGGIVILSLFTALLTLLNACTPEYRLAKSYISTLPNTGFVVIPPNHLFMSNLKATPESDSAAIANAQFIADVNDSLFLALYTATFIDELRSYGVNVNDTSLPYPLMDSTGSTVVVDMAQMSLEEYLYLYTDSDYFDTMIVYRDFDLNGVSLNVWIDLSGVDGSRKKFVTLFDSYQVSDKVDGSFRMNLMTGDINYEYTFYEMQPILVTELPVKAAQKHAIMLMDFLINESVRSKMPEDRETPILRMHYNSRSKSLLYDRSGEKFIQME